MNRIIFLLATLCSTYLTSIAQTSGGRMLFVIDSIPVLFDPPPMNELWEEDIASRSAVSNTRGLKLEGASDFDSITYIFTKEYIGRPDSIKQLPSLKQMKMKDSAWNLHDKAYTGQYVDYYFSGRKLTEGSLVNGRQDGEEIHYYQNGEVGGISNYKNGKLKGPGISYYKNGSIQSKGTYSEDGRWTGESYFPNGLIESRGAETDNDGRYSMTNFFSAGKIRQVMTFNGKAAIMDSAFRKSMLINKKIQEIKKAVSIKTAKKIAAEVLELDSTNIDVYGSLGFFMLDKNNFNAAIDMFSEALDKEPFLIQPLVYRAFARVRKYESKQVRTISDIRQYLAVSNGKKVTIPGEELEKICDDLKRADSVRTIYPYSFDQLLNEISKKYCDVDVRR